MQFSRRFLALSALAVGVAAFVGCGDAASNANKDLKPIDPNATKPVGAAAGAGGKAPAGPAAGAAPVQ